MNTDYKPAMWDLVREDISERDLTGLKKYGTRLRAFNGRDPMKDAYEEALDMVVYLRQAIYEREELRAAIHAEESSDKASGRLWTSVRKRLGLSR